MPIQSTAKRSRLAQEIGASADYLHSVGGLDTETHAKITMRNGNASLPTTTTISATDIKALRATAHMSQAVFARHLNVTAGYVSQLERGLRRPKGPALTLLDVIRRKGMGAIL